MAQHQDRVQQHTALISVTLSTSVKNEAVTPRLVQRPRGRFTPQPACPPLRLIVQLHWLLSCSQGQVRPPGLEDGRGRSSCSHRGELHVLGEGHVCESPGLAVLILVCWPVPRTGLGPGPSTQTQGCLLPLLCLLTPTLRFQAEARSTEVALESGLCEAVLRSPGLCETLQIRGKHVPLGGPKGSLALVSSQKGRVTCPHLLLNPEDGQAFLPS